MNFQDIYSGSKLTFWIVKAFGRSITFDFDFLDCDDEEGTETSAIVEKYYDFGLSSNTKELNMS